MPKGRILAVDDQRYFRELIDALLTEEGYEARTASSGEEALHVLEQSRFDVVVTDLVMPGMDGSELVHRIKQRDPDQDVVVVTGVVDVKTAVDAMKLGATDYLLKPFDRKALAVALDGILERRRLRREHERLLAENIEYLGERSLFQRAIGLFSCLALQPLAEKIVEDLCLETHGQGGVLWIDASGEAEQLALAAAGGLVRLDAEPREIARAALPTELAEGSARAALADWTGPEGHRQRALYLSLQREGRVIGVARLTDRLGDQGFDAVDRARAEKLAQLAEGALGNALRFAQLERATLQDPATGAYSFEYFRDVARNEIEKASRFGRRFSLLAFDLAEPAAGRARRGEAELTAWLESVVGRIRPLLRATDLLAARERRRLYAILPEADALGAASLKRRARDELRSSEHFAEGAPLPVAAVTYPGDGTQLETLLRALDERLEAERHSPVATLGLDALSFGEALRALLAEAEPARPATPSQLARFALGELARRPRERGLCLAAPAGRLDDAVRAGLAALDGSAAASELVVIAERPRARRVADPGVTWVSPRRVPGLPPFVLLLGDGPAWALVCGEKDADDGVPLFQTDDRSLVEHLVFRLQRELALPVSEPWGESA